MKIKIPRSAIITLALGVPKVITVVREDLQDAKDSESDGGSEITADEIEDALNAALTESGLLAAVATIIHEANNDR